MKSDTFNLWRWALPATTSLILITSAASGQDIDLDALMQQLDGERDAIVAPAEPPETPAATETETKMDPEGPEARPARVLRQLPSSYEEVVAYAGRFADHDADRTGQLVADVCNLLAKADVDLDPSDVWICISRSGED